MKTFLRMILAFGLVLGLAACGKEPQPDAEVIYTNGKIWTGDADRPWADTMAVHNGRFLAVGEAELIADLTGPTTELVNLGGRLVVPGFIDNHVHFLDAGLAMFSVDLRDAKTPREFSGRIGAFAKTLPPGEWITGGNWDHENWGGELPERSWIDELTPQNPVFLKRLDGHMILANSLALELAGVDETTPEVAGGEIVRDQNGNPTGIFKDEAMALIEDAIPPESETRREAAVGKASDYALSKGVTQVHDMSYGRDDLETYLKLHERGELRVRIYAFQPIADWRRVADFVTAQGRGDDRLWWGGLKGFVDGSLGSTTAWFYKPYLDAPETNGLVVSDLGQLERDIKAADKAGLHLAIHAIGTQANDWLLDAFDRAAKENGPRDRRFRIEHAQHLTKQAIPRFAEQGVIPSMQPYHAIDDGRWAEKRIGRLRAKTTYAFHSLLEEGANLAFGSDWDVAPMDPLMGIYAAVTRQTLDGENPKGWVPDQKISVEQALRAFTNASPGFKEDRLGAIREGYLADFVVLSADIFEIKEAEIQNVRVIKTILGGEVAYDSGDED